MKIRAPNSDLRPLGRLILSRHLGGLAKVDVAAVDKPSTYLTKIGLCASRFIFWSKKVFLTFLQKSQLNQA